MKEKPPTTTKKTKKNPSEDKSPFIASRTAFARTFYHKRIARALFWRACFSCEREQFGASVTKVWLVMLFLFILFHFIHSKNYLF